MNSRWRILLRPGIQKAPLHEKMHRERERIYLELIRFTPFAQKHPPLMLFPTVRSAKGKGEKDYSPVLFISSAKEGEKMKGFFFFSIVRDILSVFVSPYEKEIVTMVCAAAPRKINQSRMKWTKTKIRNGLMATISLPPNCRLGFEINQKFSFLSTSQMRVKQGSNKT